MCTDGACVPVIRMIPPVFVPSFLPSSLPELCFIFSQLSKELPPRTVGRAWQLAYSTSRHGTSLKSLYRRLGAAESPVLVIIKDALDEVKTCLLSLMPYIDEWSDFSWNRVLTVSSGIWGLPIPPPEAQWDVLRHRRNVPFHVASSLQGAPSHNKQICTHLLNNSVQVKNIRKLFFNSHNNLSGEQWLGNCFFF